ADPSSGDQGPGVSSCNIQQRGATAPWASARPSGSCGTNVEGAAFMPLEQPLQPSMLSEDAVVPASPLVAPIALIAAGNGSTSTATSSASVAGTSIVGPAARGASATIPIVPTTE
ncbi:unnamed protein product, partial [Amoebophrya sp. A120]